MSNVYIHLGRLIPEGEADKGIAKIAAGADAMEFKDNHPIVGHVFAPIVRAFSYAKYGRSK